MIEIDGSTGGGQMLRTALALSALANEPLRVTNIRKKAKVCGKFKPGLRPQHLTGVRITKEFCDARVKGDDVGSTEIEFVPKELKIESKRIDIGTAGSISLLLQTLTPMLIFTKEPISLEIVGGTDVIWSPPIEYLQRVAYPILSKMGINANVEIKRYGFYPKGGGLVKVEVNPTKGLKPIDLINRGDIVSIKGLSVCGNLPEHVAKRQAESAKKVMKENDHESEIETRVVESACPGSVINLWCETKNSMLGSNCIGERGVRAEIIGERAARGLLSSIESNAPLDKHMADQILIFLALAPGKSRVKVEQIINHCRTNISVIEKLLPVKFRVDDKRRTMEVSGAKL